MLCTSCDSPALCPHTGHLEVKLRPLMLLIIERTTYMCYVLLVSLLPIRRALILQRPLMLYIVGKTCNCLLILCISHRPAPYTVPVAFSKRAVTAYVLPLISPLPFYFVFMEVTFLNFAKIPHVTYCWKALWQFIHYVASMPFPHLSPQNSMLSPLPPIFLPQRLQF